MSQFHKSNEELMYAYEQALAKLEPLFRALEASVPKPVRKPYKDSFVYRYAEMSKQQAIVQKLARSISLLNATILLARSGFAYEMGMMQRMLDDDEQDIMILSMSLAHNDHQKIHDEYLQWFWFDTVTADSSTAYPGDPRRKGVFSYIANGPGCDGDPSGHIAALKGLQRGYSAYVHGASSHVFELWDPRCMLYATHGLPGTPIAHDHAADLWNCVYRLALSIHGAGVAFELPHVAVASRAVAKDLEAFAEKMY